MKAYKGFNKDMTCRGFQFEEGKTYEEDRAELCKCGFHACENPLDVFDYYSPADFSEYHEVELEDVCTKRDMDSKVVARKIKIGAKIGIKGIVDAFVDIVISKTKTGIGGSGNGAQIGSSGDEAKIGSSGDWAQIGSSGDEAKIGSSGDGAQIGSSGNWAQIGSSGDWAKIGSSGNWAQIGSSGDGAKIGSSGDWAQIGSSGDEAKIGSSGNWAKIEAKGKNTVIMCAGNSCKAKATIGSWICLAEWDEGIPVCVKAAKVDGEAIKEDTWYTLKNGEFVEAE